MQRSEFDKALSSCLRQRPGMYAGAYYLDLRSSRFGLGRIIVRQPGGPNWTTNGPTTKSADDATSWAMHPMFTQWLWQQYQTKHQAPTLAGITVRKAAERYLKSLVETDVDASGAKREIVPDHVKSRVSMIRRHIVPRLGHIAMDALNRQIVRAELESLIVHGVVDPVGRRQAVPAAHGTKLQFKRALHAIWNFTYPDLAAPFNGIRLAAPKVSPSGKLSRAAQIARHGPRARATNGALDYPDLEKALVAAMQYDMEMGGRGNLKGLFVAETVFMMVLQVALGVRVSELLTLMWGHIHENEGYVLILNAKVHQLDGLETRAVPLPEALRPWLRELRALRGDPALDELVIRTRPLDYAGPTRQVEQGTDQETAARNTVIARLAKVLRRAGLKVKRKSSHGLRATYFSLMSGAEKIEAELLKGFMGHKVIFGGSSDDYFQLLVSSIKPRHRKALKLPTPAEVRIQAANFQPAKDWKAPKKKEDRSKAGKAAARARREKRQPLGISLDRPDEPGDAGGSSAALTAGAPLACTPESDAKVA